jgi:hypothetical protein
MTAGQRGNVALAFPACRIAFSAAAPCSSSA